MSDKNPTLDKVNELRADSKATPNEIAKAKQGVGDSAILNKMDKPNVTRGELRDARIEYLNSLERTQDDTK